MSAASQQPQRRPSLPPPLPSPPPPPPLHRRGCVILIVLAVAALSATGAHAQFPVPTYCTTDGANVRICVCAAADSVASPPTLPVCDLAGLLGGIYPIGQYTVFVASVPFVGGVSPTLANPNPTPCTLDAPVPFVTNTTLRWLIFNVLLTSACSNAPFVIQLDAAVDAPSPQFNGTASVIEVSAAGAQFSHAIVRAGGTVRLPAANVGSVINVTYAEDNVRKLFGTRAPTGVVLDTLVLIGARVPVSLGYGAGGQPLDASGFTMTHVDTSNSGVSAPMCGLFFWRVTGSGLVFDFSAPGTALPAPICIIEAPVPTPAEVDAGWTQPITAADTPSPSTTLSTVLPADFVYASIIGASGAPSSSGACAASGASTGAIIGVTVVVVAVAIAVVAAVVVAHRHDARTAMQRRGSLSRAYTHIAATTARNVHSTSSSSSAAAAAATTPRRRSSNSGDGGDGDGGDGDYDDDDDDDGDTAPVVSVRRVPIVGVATDMPYRAQMARPTLPVSLQRPAVSHTPQHYDVDRDSGASSASESRRPVHSTYAWHSYSRQAHRGTSDMRGLLSNPGPS